MSLALLLLLVFFLSPLLGWALAVRHWEREQRRRWEEFEEGWEEHQARLKRKGRQARLEREAP